MFKYVVWFLKKPKKVTASEIEKLDIEYQKCFENWLNTSSKREENEMEKLLSKAAKNMNLAKNKREKWLEYAKWKGIE